MHVCASEHCTNAFQRSNGCEGAFVCVPGESSLHQLVSGLPVVDNATGIIVKFGGQLAKASGAVM